MQILYRDDVFILWQEVIVAAEKECEFVLTSNTENYLIQLLTDYLPQSDWTAQAKGYQLLSAIAHSDEREFKAVGDECLLLVGLFPHFITQSFLKPRYYVKLGQMAYLSLSQKKNDLYEMLSLQFVKLMDVLQSVRLTSDAVMTPLEAYEQWHELGSQRALQWLNWYSGKNTKSMLDRKSLS